ncbi:MAG: acyl-CoA/acyl-ACP dehydrogenase [Candidatus Tectomicrobia bacterium]|nr:acyl-CoA/acyl-ACP dehydrogenase [Candidatus Tectomicrobia bacterium]
MDFNLTEGQQLLQMTVREFFQEECSPDFIRRVEREGASAYRRLYAQMGELGMFGLAFPEEIGGAGGNWLDVIIFFQEAGRRLVPGPLLETVALALPLLAPRDGASPPAWWRAVLLGKELATAAWDLEGLTDLAVQPTGGGAGLAGRWSFVPHVDGARYVLLPAPQGERLALALLDLKEATVEQEACALQDCSTAAALHVKEARLPEAQWSEGGEVRARWDAALDRGKICVAAWGVGMMEEALRLAVGYVGERRQFGRPVGAFQALQHKLANAKTALEKARAATLYAASVAAREQPCRVEAATAKLVTGRAAQEVTTIADLAYGGYGFIVDTDIQLFYRRAKHLQVWLGSACEQERILLDAGPFMAAPLAG